MSLNRAGVGLAIVASLAGACTERTNSPLDFSAGLMEVKGNFTVAFSNGWTTALRASGTHRVLLNGTAAQSIDMYHTDYSFRQLDIDNAAGATFVRRATITSDLNLGITSPSAAKMTINAGVAVFVNGTFRLRPGTTYPNNGSMTAGTTDDQR